MPGRVLWSESVHRGTFGFCSCVRDSMLTGHCSEQLGGRRSAAYTEVRPLQPQVDANGFTMMAPGASGERTLRTRHIYLIQDEDIQLIGIFC